MAKPSKSKEAWSSVAKEASWAHVHIVLRERVRRVRGVKAVDSVGGLSVTGFVNGVEEVIIGAGAAEGATDVTTWVPRSGSIIAFLSEPWYEGVDQSTVLQVLGATDGAAGWLGTTVLIWATGVILGRLFAISGL